MPSARAFRYLRDPLFVTGAIIYFATGFLLKPLFGFTHPFATNFLGDVFLIPVALPVLLLLQRILGARDHDLPPTRTEILLWLVLWSALFEFLAPRYLHRGFADLLDVFAYASGAAVAAFSWSAFYKSPRRVI